MKRMICFALAVMLFSVLAIPAAAANSSLEIVVPTEMTVYQNEVLDLYCQASDSKGGKLSYLWYETSTGKLENIIAVNRGAETNDTLRCDTSELGTRYYVCGVNATSGSSDYSAVIAVTVLEQSEDAVLFTDDSSALVGGTLTVDIEKMANYDARVYNAFLEKEVTYQWYLDGLAVSGATGESLKLLAEYEMSRVYVVVTCYDLEFTSERFLIKMPQRPFAIDSASVPDAEVGKEYRFQLDATDDDAYFQIYYNPGKENEFEETGLTLSSDGWITGTPTKVGEYTFTVHASNDRGEDYETLTLTVLGEVTTVAVEKAPTKLVYTSGETLDLTGMEVLITLPDGTIIKSLNGDNLTVSTQPLVTVGEQKIKVSYGDAFDWFIVTVNEAPTQPAGPEATTPTQPTDPSDTPGTTEPTTPTSKPEETPSGTTGTSVDNQQSKGMPWWGIVPIAIAATGAGVGITLVVLKKKNKG